MFTEDTFTLKGQLLQRRHRNPNGSHWSLIFRFDDHGRVVEKEQLGVAPEDRQLFSYWYDQIGRLDRILLHSAKHGDRVFESVRYAADGSKTSTCYPIQLEETHRSTASVCAESALHLSIDAVAIMTVFDANDRLIRKVLYDADDRVIRRVVFRYDGRGLLIEEGEVIAGRIRDDFRNLYQYDAAGRHIEIDRRWGDLGGARRTFAYNDQSDVVEERIEQNGGLMNEDSDPQDWTQRFAYEYDPHGNWTERKTETITKVGEARLTMIERRDVTYY
jgi:hypothetical protein